MAAVLSADWKHKQHDAEMDVSATNPGRQRSSPANEGGTQQNPQNHHQHTHQQPHAFPIQQQQALGSWTPSIAATPFYPAFYQGQQQQQHHFAPQLAHQPPYFDPANAQLAQWAYQQMMFNAQHGFPQRTASSQSDYFAQSPFNPFPSGTPPPHAQRPQQQDHQQQGPQNAQYPGFHPYRRPNRQQNHSQDSQSDWRPGMPHIPQPPYARPDASASSSSVSSSASQRQRTNSNQSGHSGHNVPSPNSISRSRNNGSPNPSASSSARSSPAPASSSSASTPKASTQQQQQQPPRLPHNRNASSSSTSTSASSRPSMLSQSSPTTATSPASSSSATSSSTYRLARPSPLSQGSTFTASEKRMSRDDSDLAAMLESASKASSGIGRSSGLKGRLRRALSFNALKEEEDNDDDDDESIKASNFNNTTPKAKGKESSLSINSSVARPETAGGIRSPDSGLDDTESTATIQTKKKSRAASLFNSRLNASTDNISLSSTVSSASVMIRKLGSMSKLVVRRNSLAGITSIFKDKNKDGDKSKKKDKKSAKTAAVQAEVSHVHAELDRSVTADANGLSPAAELARQHTLKTKAENAAKAKAQQEAQAAAAAAAASSSNANGTTNGGAGVATWDKNTTTRAGTTSPVKRSGGVRVSEDGTRVVVEDEDEDSDDGQYDPQANNSYNIEGWDDDDDWDVPEDEDLTVRMTKATITEEPEEDVEPWAMDIRRSVERTRRPMRGILKNAGSYDQAQYLGDQPIPTRARSNSYNSHPGQAELGPLARIPSPDPDHIDGLHRHNSHSSGHSNSAAPSIPPLKFDGSSSPLAANFNTSAVDTPPSQERPPSIFQHPALNSSAPALSMVPSSAPTLTHRSATVPAKKLAFATSLSVYDTFPATVYDRRSEPATWSRLTPALAQRIKEELNSYKMEEMEVHAASRIHTQFFV